MQRDDVVQEPAERLVSQLPTVLVVDDTPDNLAFMSALLGEHYHVKVASSGARALKAAQAAPVPDLILLDIMMPDMDGYEVCGQLKANDATRDIPVIFLTARADTEDERKGFALGAVDYVTKPVSPPIVLARVQTHLALKATADFLRDKSAYLEREVALRTLEVQAIQDVTIMAMASLAETRDDETGNHIRRTQLYVSDPTGRARTPSRRNLLGARWSTVAVRATHDRQAIGAFWARTLAWSGCVFDIGEAHGSRLACFDHPV